MASSPEVTCCVCVMCVLYVLCVCVGVMCACLFDPVPLVFPASGGGGAPSL